MQFLLCNTSSTALGRAAAQVPCQVHVMCGTVGKFHHILSKPIASSR